MTISLSDIKEYSGSPYIAINDNEPFFEADEMTSSSFENYSSLDNLGRCGVATACVGIDLMPTEKRGDISSVKPTAWHSVKYDFVDGKSLYNRCHLIGYQLSGENANKRNLITGTRYMNVEGMLPFENMVADYVKETENHVMYRVTPLFDGNNLLASGVLMEGYSVEDDGDGVCFNIYAYNVQPGVYIDYSNGESKEDNTKTFNQNSNDNTEGTYILNTNTKKFHKPNCSSVKKMKDKNKKNSKEKDKI